MATKASKQLLPSSPQWCRPFSVSKHLTELEVVAFSLEESRDLKWAVIVTVELSTITTQSVLADQNLVQLATGAKQF